MQAEKGETQRRILIVDDEENLRHMLTLVLTRAGYGTQAAGTVDEALGILEAEHYDIVLTDLRMPHRSGMELVEAVKARHPETYVILMTAYGSIDLAVDAMARGAYDYISKPFKPNEILLTLKKIEEREGLVKENRLLKSHLESQPLEGMIGASAAMGEIARLARRFAAHPTTILITGESGTGKDLLARAIHGLSDRKAGPFVAVNCAAIPEALMESELFGHTRGAFTGAIKDKDGLFVAANGGTLFLDELGELPIGLQSKLLRALESGEIRPVGESKPRPVDVRILCATARDMVKLVKDGGFREDLFYRINVLALHLPPLRDRPEDILPLARHFLEASAQRVGRPLTGISREALSLMMAHSWPGNIRELQHAIERAVILADGDMLDVGDLPPVVGQGGRAAALASEEPVALSIKQATRDLERRLITRALEKTGGNRTHAAALLEISHRTLLYKMKEYGIDVPRQS